MYFKILKIMLQYKVKKDILQKKEGKHMKKRIMMVLFFILIICNSVGSVFGANFEDEVKLKDGTEIKKGVELESTKEMQLYQQVPKGSAAGSIVYDYSPIDEKLQKNTILEVLNVHAVNGADGKVSEAYVCIRFTGSEKANPDASREYWIKLNLKSSNPGVKKASRSDDEEKANQEFIDKYGDKDISKMSKDELLKMEEDAEKLTAPNQEILGMLQELDERKLEIGATTTGDTIYQKPNMTSNTTNAEESLDDVVSDADDFINVGNEDVLQSNSLENFSKTMYNILLAIGIAVAVIVGGIIGIKLMSAGIEEKADAKKLLVPYFVGCIVVFGAFGIWKLVVTILSSV